MFMYYIVPYTFENYTKARSLQEDDHVPFLVIATGRRVNAAVRVILMTGWNEDDTRKYLQNLGFPKDMMAVEFETAMEYRMELMDEGVVCFKDFNGDKARRLSNGSLEIYEWF